LGQVSHFNCAGLSLYGLKAFCKALSLVVVVVELVVEEEEEEEEEED